MLDHKTSLFTFKKTANIQSIFSGYNEMKLEINSRRKIEKSTNMWKLNNALFFQVYYSNIYIYYSNVFSSIYYINFNLNLFLP